ncbi:adhesion G-protein coupled receptor G6-like [Physella acuta]|uniref:adhesion G-protein coupled receptor G6-like n=1 Tax=Physella acuta TaxID=109671 RepID=UPI0027DDFDB6|nr:adhesion G-protein coupled receptor G6-like [Physella acuta]
MLSIISIVGSSISFCCLVMTVFTYTVFRNLRRHSPSKIVYNLCWALLLFNGLFLLGRYFPTILREAVRCKAMAALLHYSLLASMFWMSVNAFYMYISVVKVFNVQIARFILKCFLFAWGLPAVLVVLTLLINDTENYGRLYTNFCWIRKPAFYVTLVSPVATSLLINLAVFCLSMIEISKSNKRHSSMLINERKSFMANFRVAFVLLILLGLTWTFAFFSFGELGTLFSYLFSIFNSLQGMFIFTFYCLLKREVHNAWLVLCGCQIEDIVITSKYSESRVSRSSLSKQSKYYEFKFTTSKDSGSSSAQEG